MKKKKAVDKGLCSLVGGGPGDTGLVTLRARERIGAADVIYYDALVNPDILEWARPGAELVYVGKRAGRHAMKQSEINACLVGQASAGLRVVRLKGGDPFVFGRGGEEAMALVEAGVPFEVVPGVSSAIAGPAYAGIPVTHRDFNAQFTVLTGHEHPEKTESSIDWPHLATTPGTKVLLMGIERLAGIAAKLIEAGADPATPVALIGRATTPDQQTLTGTLADIGAKAEKAGFAPPALIVLGGVVALREQLAWFDRRPLFGKRIVVTRTREQAGALSEQLAGLGARVIELPTIRIEPPADLREFVQSVLHAHDYDWLVFTSPNGATRFFDQFYMARKDARELGGARIAAVGPSTAAAIESFRFGVDLLPEKFVAESLLEALLKCQNMENVRVLVVRPESARDIVVDGLARAGAIVDSAIAYRTVPERRGTGSAIDELSGQGADAITFTSASTVRNFLALGIPWPKGMRAASIGPVTSVELQKAGITVEIEAKEHDISGLVKALQENLL